MGRPFLIPKEDFVRALWKNGLGHTDQIAIEPSGADLRAGNYLWRLSTALIAHDSVFSVFPDHDRALVVLSGGGLRMIHEEPDFGDSVELPSFEPYEFPGDIRSRCELLAGPVQDFSVFFRKGVVQAEVEVVHLEADAIWEWRPVGTWNFIFAVRGAFEVGIDEGVAETLETGDAFRVNGNGSEESPLYPVVPHGSDSILISIRLAN